MSSKNQENAKLNRHGAMLGMEGLVKRLAREGQPALSDTVAKKLTLCKQLMDEHAEKALKLEEGYERPLADLRVQTAKALLKIMPKGVFADSYEAEVWSHENLPMAEARSKEAANRDKYTEAVAQNNTLVQKFWKLFSEACSIANGKLDGSNSVFEKELIKSGLDRLQ